MSNGSGSDLPVTWRRIALKPLRRWSSVASPMGSGSPSYRRKVGDAQELLETTDTPVEQGGALVGIPAATTFRQRFRTVTGVTPSGYRATLRARA